MSDEETVDVVAEMTTLAEATGKALVEDAKDILKDAGKSGSRVAELSAEVMKWQLKAQTEQDAGLKARYQHEFDSAFAAMETRLISEALVADVAAREALMKRFEQFKEGALTIGKKVLTMGVKVGSQALLGSLGGVGGDLAGELTGKILEKIA